MKARLRMTTPTQLVLRALLEDLQGRHYGLQLCARTGLLSGTVYPILMRLEQAGWVTSSWEDPDEHAKSGHPRRRYYWITEDGAEQARIALAQVDQRRKGRAAASLGLAPGVPGVLS
jgi:DNA-binding MarR family transcriptional regulator